MNAVIDRVVEFPHRYKLTDVSTGVVLGTFDFTPETGVVQVTGTPINKVLFDSIAADIARIDTAIPSKFYKSFAEVSDTITTSSDILDVIKLMNDNSILVTQVSDGDSTHYDNIVPSTSYRLGVLEIIKYSNNRTACRYTAMHGMTQANPCQMWFGETQTDTSQTPNVLVWSGWAQSAKFVHPNNAQSYSQFTGYGNFAVYLGNATFSDSGLSKTTNISASSTDLQIPTAKAVYDCVAGNSSAETFTFIVDSDEALAAWANNTAGNDYTRVLIKDSRNYTSGTNSGKYTISSAVNVYQSGTLLVVGEAGATVYFSGTTYQTSGFTGSRTVLGISDFKGFFNLKIETNYCGFYDCHNINNCLVNCVNSSKGRLYYLCFFINECGATGYINAGFYNCQYINHCFVKGNSGSVTGFDNCQIIVGCEFLNENFTEIYNKNCSRVIRNPDTQSYTIATSDWSAYSDPIFKYTATVSNTADIGAEIVTDSEIIMDVDVETVAAYGLVLKSVNMSYTPSKFVFLATSLPSSSISVDIIIK